MPRDMHTRTALLTCTALVAFAANSILCRLALRSASIDPAAFTLVRLASGAVVLWLMLSFGSASVAKRGWQGWQSAVALFGYAAAFSFAYVSLDAGVGALILFAAVQSTMIVGGFWAGERPHARQWIGLSLAMSGLAWLVLPGTAAPNSTGACLMALAGVAWGFYSLIGRGTSHPVADNAGNFLRSTVFAVALAAVLYGQIHLSPAGILWAVLSGAIASGIGYAVWYAAVRGLTATTAAVVQLTVPVLAAVAGVLVLSEPLTPRLVIAGAVILGGVGIALVRR
ncbi:MAG: DMT family transporter [bacterium]|nr:DMT family transporter [bacterium]